MVPLTVELDRDYAENHGVSPLVFRNAFLNSPNGCLPLRLAQEKETTEAILIEKNRLLQAMASAEACVHQPSNFPNVRVTLVGFFTMHDQVCNYVLIIIVNIN